MSRLWDGHAGARGAETVRKLGRACARPWPGAGAGLGTGAEILQLLEGADPVPVAIRARAAWKKNRKARGNCEGTAVAGAPGRLSPRPPGASCAPRLPWLPGSSGS